MFLVWNLKSRKKPTTTENCFFLYSGSALQKRKSFRLSNEKNLVFSITFKKKLPTRTPNERNNKSGPLYILQKPFLHIHLIFLFTIDLFFFFPPIRQWWKIELWLLWPKLWLPLIPALSAQVGGVGICSLSLSLQPFTSIL